MTPDPGKATSPAWQSGTRPSLFSGATAAHDDGPVSILSAMDDTPPATRTKLTQRQLWPWLGGGLLAAVGLIWLASTQRAEAERPSEPAIVSMAAASAPTRVQAVASAPVADVAASLAPAIIEATVAASPAPVAAPVAVAVAAITAPAIAPAPGTSDATLLMATGAGVAAATTLAATTVEPAASAPKKLNKRAKARAERESATAAKAAHTSPTRKASAETSAATAAGSKADPDVDLIAALMRHGETGSTSRHSDSDTSATSIAALVSRCKSQGGDEAKACRQRLCEGYWGKAEACPKRLAPKKSTKTTATAKTEKRKKKKPAATPSDSKA